MSAQRLTARRKKLRQVQVREAQRRRRERLKGQNQRFLQILVSTELHLRLIDAAEVHNCTVQEVTSKLLHEALDAGMVERLDTNSIVPEPAPKARVPRKETAPAAAVPPTPISAEPERIEEMQPTEIAAISEISIITPSPALEPTPDIPKVDSLDNVIAVEDQPLPQSSTSGDLADSEKISATLQQADISKPQAAGEPTPAIEPAAETPTVAKPRTRKAAKTDGDGNTRQFELF